MTGVAAIVLAAGRGSRMGADKALLELGGETAIERVVRVCRKAGCESVVVVRAGGAAALPGIDADVLEVAPGREMLDSVRAGVAAVDPECAGTLVFPVDFAMVGAAAACAVVEGVRDGAAVVLPLLDGRPGHPVGLARRVFDEVQAAAVSLREVVTADRDRVRVVRVADPWVRRDLDTPADLAAARTAIEDGA